MERTAGPTVQRFSFSNANMHQPSSRRHTRARPSSVHFKTRDMLASALASLNGGGRDRRHGPLPRWVLPAVALFAVLVRVVVSTHPHSGQSSPPMFGDYEAQRHWMELTLHTPLAQWYTHTTLNDLQYWGLDYPPLTAFQSWVCGVWMLWMEPASVALTTSRGWESYRSKLAMRFTVIVSDLLFTLPAVHLFVRAFYGREKGGNGARNAWATALILLAPGPILIDHGHFQYNNWSLGLTTYAVAAILHGKHVCGSVLFTLSLCHKQMSLYHAPAFFAHLFGRCLRSERPALEVAKLAAAVLGTMSVVFAPFYFADAQGLDGVAAVLTRLAPFKRGLFEDYVANFWCATSPMVKWRRLLTVSASAKLAGITTLCAMAPAVVRQIQRPSHEGFLWCMACVATSFFLFSFQVHEKSILLPAMPISLLCLRAPKLATAMPVLACLSMWPLLRKDGLGVAYLGCVVLFTSLFGGEDAPEKSKRAPEASPKKKGWRLPGWIPSPGKKRGGGGVDGDGSSSVSPDQHEWVESALEAKAWRWIGRVLAVGGCCLHAFEVLVMAPRWAPYLHSLTFTTFGFLGFVCVWGYCYVRLWACPCDDGVKKEKVN